MINTQFVGAITLPSVSPPSSAPRVEIALQDTVYSPGKGVPEGSKHDEKGAQQEQDVVDKGEKGQFLSLLRMIRIPSRSGGGGCSWLLIQRVHSYCCLKDSVSTVNCASLFLQSNQDTKIMQWISKRQVSKGNRLGFWFSTNTESSCIGCWLAGWLVVRE